MLLISLITAVQVILIIKIWMMTGDVRNAYSGGYPFSISGDIRSVPS